MGTRHSDRTFEVDVSECDDTISATIMRFAKLAKDWQFEIRRLLRITRDRDGRVQAGGVRPEVPHRPVDADLLSSLSIGQPGSAILLQKINSRNRHWLERSVAVCNDEILHISIFGQVFYPVFLIPGSVYTEVCSTPPWSSTGCGWRPGCFPRTRPPTSWPRCSWTRPASPLWASQHFTSASPPWRGRAWTLSTRSGGKSSPTLGR